MRCISLREFTEVEEKYEQNLAKRKVMIQSGTVIVYQGSKYFWKTRNTIDVILVKHKIENVLEVIAYEPALDVEAPRLYMDLKILSLKLDHEAIAAKMSLAKQNNVPHTEKIVEGLANCAISEFILNRLFTKQYPKEEGIFKIQLQFTFSDMEDANGVDALDKLLCDKPASLCPFSIHHQKASLHPTPHHSQGSEVDREQASYMDGTTTSESRNKAAAKEKALEKRKEMTARKLAKRGSKSKAKNEMRKSDSQGCEKGLVGQLIAGLASFTASYVSSKHSTNKVHVEEIDVEDMVTSRMSGSKSFCDILEETCEPSESYFNSVLTTNRRSQTLPGVSTVGGLRAGVNYTSCDELEGADATEVDSSPRRRQTRFSWGNAPETSDCDSARTRTAPFPSNFPIQTPRIAKLSAKHMKCANPHNQVHFNEATGMYERQLTSVPTGSRVSFAQALGGAIYTASNLRTNLSWR